jgi:hypothetical protein
MDAKELDDALRRELGLAPRNPVKEVLDRIVDTMPPHLRLLVDRVNRTPPGGNLYPIGGGPTPLELQHSLNEVVTRTFTPEVALLLGQITLARADMALLLPIAERQDIPNAMRRQVATLLRENEAVIKHLMPVLDALTGFAARAALIQDEIGTKMDRARDELFQIELQVAAIEAAVRARV